jgi:hypothetical protein
MSRVAGDRVHETATTTGTGDLSLLGAESGKRAFSAIAANGDIVEYFIQHRTAAEWEQGVGTWVTGNTLQRTRVIRSSNSNAAVSFSSGTKDVFNTWPADYGLAPPVGRVQTEDRYLAPSMSLYVAEEYEIAANKELELDTDAILEIG